MADPRRMTPEEHGEAHALLVRVVTDPDWQAAGQALDDLMGKLLVIRRLLEAEERLPKREPRAEPMERLQPRRGWFGIRSTSAGGFRLAPRRSRLLLLAGGRALDRPAEATRQPCARVAMAGAKGWAGRGSVGSPVLTSSLVHNNVQAAANVGYGRAQGRLGSVQRP